MRQRDAAICLRAIDYSETSQVVHFLLRAGGVVSLMAKGTKRPKSKSGGAIDLTSEGDLIYTTSRSGAMGTLIEFTELTPHLGLRRKAENLNAALFLLELVAATILEDDPHPGVFDLLHNGLARLDEADAPVPAVVAYFLWRLLRHVGLAIRTDSCVECDRQPGPGASFCSTRGGLLCRDCEGRFPGQYPLDSNTKAGLSALAAVETGRKVVLPEAQARGVGRLLAYHVGQQSGKALKLTRHVLGP